MTHAPHIRLVVEANRITKMWTPLAGLQPTDLSVAGGEVVAIKGRSGTGKSTLLALLGGFCEPDAGRVLIGGRPPGPDEAWSWVSLVPQVFALARELTVRENVTDALATPLDRATVDQLLAGLDLAEIADRFTDHVSVGQQQRTALARAVVTGPTLLLADEPTSAESADHTSMIIEQLRLQARHGSAVIVATHDPHVWRAADRIVDLDRIPETSAPQHSPEPSG